MGAFPFFGGKDRFFVFVSTTSAGTPGGAISAAAIDAAGNGPSGAAGASGRLAGEQP